MGFSILILGIITKILKGNFLLSATIGALFFGGCMSPICMGPIQALIQSSVDPRIQGRVISLMESASTIITPFGVWFAGVIFDRFEPQSWYLWGGIAAITISIVGFATPVILNLGCDNQ